MESGPTPPFRFGGPSDAVLLNLALCRSHQIERDATRLAARQRQLDLGIRTAGFQNLSAALVSGLVAPPVVPMPNKFEISSRRSWTIRLRRWRKFLHVYDGQISALPGESGDCSVFVGELCGALGVFQACVSIAIYRPPAII
jgi:hypothetical protein